MRKTAWMLGGAIGLAVTSVMPVMAADGQGISLDPDRVPWARWQGRLSLSTNSPSRVGLDSPNFKLSSATLMGDYYFGRSLTGLGNPGGFRATSGLIFGPRSQLATGQPGLAAGGSFSIGSRLFGNAPIAGTRDAADVATLPYLGVGYTGLSPRSGWSFSADLGLVAQSPGGLKLIRSQSLDDAVREMRLAPLVQLGASYSF